MWKTWLLSVCFTWVLQRYSIWYNDIQSLDCCASTMLISHLAKMTHSHNGSHPCKHIPAGFSQFKVCVHRIDNLLPAYLVVLVLYWLCQNCYSDWTSTVWIIASQNILPMSPVLTQHLYDCYGLHGILTVFSAVHVQIIMCNLLNYHYEIQL